jgi:hypothetical protein
MIAGMPTQKLFSFLEHRSREFSFGKLTFHDHRLLWVIIQRKQIKSAGIGAVAGGKLFLPHYGKDEKLIFW